MKKPLIVLFAVVAQSVHGTPSPYQPPHAPATKSAYLTLPPGAVEPQGWLRDWCEQVRDGFTGRMEDVNPAFKQAWAADYRITGSPAPICTGAKAAGRMRVAGTGLRGCAIAEIGWSARPSRNFQDFSTRLAPFCRRLELLGVGQPPREPPAP